MHARAARTVVEAVGAELDEERAARVLEVPLGVHYGLLGYAKLTAADHLAPALGLADGGAGEGTRRRVDNIELVLAVFAPIDEELARLRAIPCRPRLEPWREEAAL